MDRGCRESEGKVKIEGYMSVSDEEAHQRKAFLKYLAQLGDFGNFKENHS